MNSEEIISQNFWQTIQDYPNYPNLLKRRLMDLNFIISKLNLEDRELKSVLDLGCGDGSILLGLREYSSISSFYGYDLSETLLKKLQEKWGNDTRLHIVNANLNANETFPTTDITLSLGSFPYIFLDNELSNILGKIQSDILIVRSPCTLLSKAEKINTYSKELQANYAALYRTQKEYIDLLSSSFVVEEIVRSYPDEIESAYGTKHFFFVCRKKVL